MLSFKHYVTYRENNSDDSGFLGNSSVGGDVTHLSAALAKALSAHKSKVVEFLRKLNDEKINAILDQMNANELNKPSFGKAPDNVNVDFLATNTADSASSEIP